MSLSDLERVIPAALPRIVAAEIAPDGSLELFQRSEDGRETRVLREPYSPWLLTAGTRLAEAFGAGAHAEPLSGEGFHRCRVRFDSWGKFDEALKTLKDLTGQSPSAPLAPYRVFDRGVQQALMDRQIRLFRGMEFSQLRRMQLDIECRSSRPGVFCDAKNPDDIVFMVALKDSTGYEECLTEAQCGGEAGLLRTLVDRIQRQDPDVLEGHNIFSFDLDYLEKRCRLHKIPFALGRNGAIAKGRPSRLSIAEKIVNYRRYDIYGRHVVDTYHLVMLYDVSRRDLESYGLKPCARHFGIAREGRVYVPGNEISALYDQDPARLAEYNLDDVRETDGLSRILSPSYFYQTQLLPVTYQNCVVRGNATRIDAMLCAAYLARGAALPAPQSPVPFEGALTSVESIGVFRPAWHLDVRSLYPSVLLKERQSPARDPLGVFIHLLEHFREFRLQAKDAARTAPTPEKKKEFQALQNSFKILINSFYGYLGFAQGTFNDYALAQKVTAEGRAILEHMKALLEEQKARILEMDTDGIYFQPPGGVQTGEMRARIQQFLPQGIEVELDGVFAAMFSYKSKNYALLEDNGKISLHGAALRSRGLEPFLRRFIREALHQILLQDNHDLTPLREQYLQKIREHALPLSDFLKKENLTQSVDAYQKAIGSGKGKRSAVYELAARAKARTYAAGDPLRYYVTGTKKSVSVVENAKLEEEADPASRDENIAYYTDKLASLADKLQATLA